MPIIYLLVLFSGLGGASSAASAGFAADFPWSNHIRSVQAKDGIPALTNPDFADVEDITYLADEDIVVGVVSGGVARAYPQMLYTGISGSFAGRQLQLLPTVETTWKTWRTLFPNTQAPVPQTGWDAFGGGRLPYPEQFYISYPYFSSNIGDYRRRKWMVAFPADDQWRYSRRYLALQGHRARPLRPIHSTRCPRTARSSTTSWARCRCSCYSKPRPVWPCPTTTASMGNCSNFTPWTSWPTRTSHLWNLPTWKRAAAGIFSVARSTAPWQGTQLQ